MNRISRHYRSILSVAALSAIVFAIQTTAQTPKAAGELAASAKAREEVAKAKASGKELAQSVNKFTLDLYRTASSAKGKETSNFVIAPYSVAEALGLAYVGARGKTAAEIAKVMHLKLNPEQAGPAFASLGVGAGSHLAEESLVVVKHRFGAIVKESAGAGVEIVEVKENSPAEKAGLKAQDRITRLGDYEIVNSIDYANALDAFTDSVDGEIRSAGSVKRFTAKLTPPAEGAKRLLPRIANAFWARQGLEFVPAFKDTAASYFDAAAQTVDFQGEPAKVRTQINQWVADKTDDAILNLLPADAITKETALVLTNAISLQAEWSSHFNPGATNNDSFYAPDGKRTVRMMHKTGAFRYGKGDGFQVLELPLDGDFAVTLLLPAKRDGLAEFEKSYFTYENLEAWLKVLRVKRVAVALPRFKISAEADVKQALVQLGMPNAFEKGADFSGITSQKEISLSALVHKAEFEVNEKGVKAAAASAVTATVREQATDEFTADRPFLFLLRDTRQDVILFVGRVTTPAKAETLK